MAELAQYELEDGIATVTIDDGKVNAFSIEMLETLHAALDRAQSDAAVLVIVGREGYFSAGFDLKVFGEGVERTLEMLTLGATLSERILSFARPVVTACSGHAIAAGSFLPLCADVRVGTEGPFKIGLNEVKIGLTVPWFAIELARQRLSRAEFDAAVGCARMYSPTEAVRAGFLDSVVPAGQLHAAAHEQARALAELNAEAHAATKLRVREGALRRLRAAIETELTVEGLGAART
jgi:enoyl-CoA hydratase